MAWMFEVYYAWPVDLRREERIVEAAAKHSGEQTFREVPTADSIMQTVVLTLEFKELADAEAAASELIQLGEHVENISDYGDD